jgi:hypothetical protein
VPPIAMQKQELKEKKKMQNGHVRCRKEKKLLLKSGRKNISMQGLL